jgi:uncharacterized protein YlxW (UPF0749 family)
MRKWQMPVTIACLLTGMFAVSAYRTQSAYLDARPDINKNKNLVSMIQYLESETKSMGNHVDQLRSEIDTIQKTQASGSKNAEKLQKEIERLTFTTGLSDVTAPGIIITLDDNKLGADAAKTADATQYNPEDYIVHDKNLLYLTTALRNAGAKSISINDQRVITSTDIRCVGTVIMVNSLRLAPPYIIKAIGDPNQLVLEIQKSDEYIYIQSKNLPMQIVKQDKITIPAYNGRIKFTYAQIPKEGAK